jgi:hypothetical protein
MSTYSTWRKSSYSGSENACVELAWRKSSYSAPENNCVEVSAVAIRDSKNPAGPRLHIADLAGFLTEAKAGRLNP